MIVRLPLYNLDENIAVVKLFPGISKSVIESVLNTSNLKAVILETYGAGNCTTEKWFINILKNTISKGIYIINITMFWRKCYDGPL